MRRSVYNFCRELFTEETAEAVNGDEKEVKTLKASVGVVDLWKNGERLWKEGGFDSDYLQKNPDR